MLVGNLAEPLMRLGRWREALDLITESLADDPSGIFASTLLLLRGEVRLWQGDAEAAERGRPGGAPPGRPRRRPAVPRTGRYIEAELDRVPADTRRPASGCAPSSTAR